MDYSGNNVRSSAVVFDDRPFNDARETSKLILRNVAQSILEMTDSPSPALDAAKQTFICDADMIMENFSYEALDEKWQTLNAAMKADPAFERDWKLHYTLKPGEPPQRGNDIPLDLNLARSSLDVLKRELQLRGMSLTEPLFDQFQQEEAQARQRAASYRAPENSPLPLPTLPLPGPK